MTKRIISKTYYTPDFPLRERKPGKAVNEQSREYTFRNPIEIEPETVMNVLKHLKHYRVQTISGGETVHTIYLTPEGVFLDYRAGKADATNIESLIMGHHHKALGLEFFAHEHINLDDFTLKFGLPKD